MAREVNLERRINVERRAEIGQERRARTRAHIIKVALDLFGQEDGRSTRIDNICEQAHVSRGTFYNYFCNMDELADALRYHISNDINLAIRDALRKMRPGAERASAGIRYYFYKAREDASWGWTIVNLNAGGPLFGSDTLRHVTDTIDEGIKIGDFEVSSLLIGRDLHVGALLASMITFLASDQPPNYPELVARQILIGLGVEKGAAERYAHSELPALFGQGSGPAKATPKARVEAVKG